LPRLAGVAQQLVDLRRSEVAWVDAYHRLAGPAIEADLVAPAAAPFDSATDMAECELHELPYRMRLARRQHVVVGLGLLHDQPHAFDIVAGVAPVTLCIEIAEIERLLPVGLDGGNGPRDLACHESLAAHRAFMIEQNAVGGVDAVGLAIVD